MNATVFSNADIMLIIAAIAVSFTLGGALRLGRTAVRERRAVELTDQDLRALSDRYKNQQRSVSRLTRELSDVRQALMQQAMAMGPVHAALRSPEVPPAPMAAVQVPVAPAPAPAVAPAPATVAPVQVSAQVTPAPVVAAAPPAAAVPEVAVRETAPAAKTPKVVPAVRPAPTTRPTAPAAGKAAARPPAAKTRMATPLELARAGAPVDLLMSRCGLSRAEAELVVSVHGKSKQTAA